LITNPELYLRLLGEQVLRDRNETDLGLVDIASAFAAVDAVSLPIAQSVVREYALAAQLRGFGIPGADEAPQPAPISSPPPAPRVAWGHIEDDHNHGFRYAVLSDRHAEVTFSYNGSSDWSEVAKHFPKPQGFPGWLLLEDDTGKVLQAHRESQQMGGPWTGRFITQAPLSRTTRWLDIGGRRMVLQPENPPSQVSQHKVAAGSAAVAYLRHLAARTVGTHSPYPTSVEDVAAAFRACGLIDPADPIFNQIAAIADLVNGPPSAAVPTRWASLSRGTTPRQKGTLLVGATTPVLEGTAIAVLAIECTHDDLIVEIWQFGGTQPMPWGAVQPALPLAWWAQDDLGGWYRGRDMQFGGSRDNWRAAVSFSPPLDAGASRLSLMPMALSSYALIDIDLEGTWGPHS
jgi:hypothetical protein